MNVLFKQQIKRQTDLANVTMVVKKLSLEHLQDIIAVQQKVMDQIDNESTLQPLTEGEYAYILKGNGLIIGAFVFDELIALRALLVPKIDEEHLGLDIGLNEQDLSQVIYQEISMVLPKYRGNRIQQTLAKIMMAELMKDNHLFRYICCTVAPFNIPSLKDKFSQGMVIKGLKEKYGNKLRYIFVKDLLEERKMYSDIQRRLMGDIVGQQQLIEKGYEGFRMEIMDNEVWVLYGIN